MRERETMNVATATRKVPSARTTRSDTTINIRVSKMWRDLIDNAASVLGKTRTDFVVESARNHAIDVLLDQRFFSLKGDQYEAFLQVLDKPPLPSERLKRLLASKSPWEV
jgi:uncharacterized protein (DUF1778 family)